MMDEKNIASVERLMNLAAGPDRGLVNEEKWASEIASALAGFAVVYIPDNANFPNAMGILREIALGVYITGVRDGKRGRAMGMEWVRRNEILQRG